MTEFDLCETSSGLYNGCALLETFRKASKRQEHHLYDIYADSPRMAELLSVFAMRLPVAMQSRCLPRYFFTHARLSLPLERVLFHTRGGRRGRTQPRARLMDATRDHFDRGKHRRRFSKTHPRLLPLTFCFLLLCFLSIAPKTLHVTVASSPLFRSTVKAWGRDYRFDLNREEFILFHLAIIIKDCCVIVSSANGTSVLNPSIVLYELSSDRVAQPAIGLYNLSSLSDAMLGYSCRLVLYDVVRSSRGGILACILLNII